MAREARKKSSTGLYHILIRTGDRIFLDDSDREQFCQLLKEYFSVTAVLYGIRISDRKIHLIADEKNTDIASVIKPFCTSYARYYNRVHSVNGKLFEGRFKSEPIESDAMLSSVAAYLYRDCPQDFGKESFVTANKKIKLEKAVKIPVMDDYENMSVEELSGIINFILPDIDALSDKEKLSAVRNADVDSRMRIGIVRKALGIGDDVKADTVKKATPKKTTSKKTTQKKTNTTQKTVKEDISDAVEITEQQEKDTNTPKKKELSVWLL